MVKFNLCTRQVLRLTGPTKNPQAPTRLVNGTLTPSADNAGKLSYYLQQSSDGMILPMNYNIGTGHIYVIDYALQVRFSQSYIVQIYSLLFTVPGREYVGQLIPLWSHVHLAAARRWNLVLLPSPV